MARAGDFKILKDNRSSYNLIAHEHHVPQSPLFGPGPQHMSPRREYEHPSPRREYEERPRAAREDRGMRDDRGDGQREVQFVDDQQQTKDEWDNTQEVETSRRAEPDYKIRQDYRSTYDMIQHDQHVPASPLYRPGQGPGQGRSQFDPRFAGGRGGYEVPRPKDPPTPDYNTQQLHFSENNDDDTKLQLGGMRGSQEDLRDDRPVNRGGPYSDRAGFHPGDRSYREQPWTQRDTMQGGITDPRLGAGHDGLGLVGSRNGGALLFIRFSVGQGENVQVAAQAFLKSKTHDNGGRFLGLAKKAFDFGYEKHPVEAIGVFHFPTIEKAFLFFQMDPIIRQPDFPPPYGHAEMWIISNAYLPDNLQLFSTFLLSEVELHKGKDKREFFETFQKPFESYLYKNGAMPFVICSYGAHDRKSLRRHTYPTSSIVTCHLFQGLDHLNWITNDETYSKFRSLHNQMATEKCSIFTLNKDMFP